MPTAVVNESWTCSSVSTFDVQHTSPVRDRLVREVPMTTPFEVV